MTTTLTLTSTPNTHHSSTLEKILEARFLADLQRELWLSGEHAIEVLHASADTAGYDVLLEARRQARHTQLKVKVRGGKRASFIINQRLTEKPSGCVVVIEYDPATLEIGPFLWLGGEPGQPLPALGAKVARHTKGNALGQKTHRPGHREVTKGAFQQVPTMAELVERLFGPKAATSTAEAA